MQKCRTRTLCVFVTNSRCTQFGLSAQYINRHQNELDLWAIDTSLTESSNASSILLTEITITENLSKFQVVSCSLGTRENCIRGDLDSLKSNLQLIE